MVIPDFNDSAPAKRRRSSGESEEDGLYFYHPDHLGSTSYITDASGEVTQHIEYMAFGELFVEEGEDDDIFGDDEGVRYLFNAKELDALPVRAFLRQSRPGYDG